MRLIKPPSSGETKWLGCYYQANANPTQEARMSEPKKSIKELVAESLAGSSDERKRRVVEHLTEQALVVQVNQILKGKELLETAEKDLANIRPDKTFTPAGELIAETFTQDKLNQQRKAKEKVTQLTQALDKALDEGNFDQLAKLVKSGGGEPQGVKQGD
jgi:hypothetical protein